MGLQMLLLLQIVKISMFLGGYTNQAKLTTYKTRYGNLDMKSTQAMQRKQPPEVFYKKWCS